MNRATPILLLALALLPLLTACPDDPYPDKVRLYQTSGAPPSLTASLDNDPDAPRLDLTVGVAMAVRCWESNINDCEQVTVTMDPPDVLAVHDVDVLSGYPQHAFALVGLKKGSGVLTVKTPKATGYYTVFVEPPPAP